MAVSGRKISDFQGSVSLGSAEDFKHSCDPCLSENQHIEAESFCVECQEYLCMQCFRFHKKTKATKHHQLLGKDEMDTAKASAKPAEVCTEKCPIHSNEVIKFFCPRHEDLGCNDCMTMKHRTCVLDYIPDVCTGLGETEEYRQTIRALEEKMKESDAVVEKAAVKNKEIDESHDLFKGDLDSFRKEINTHLASCQKKIEADASKRRETSKQEVQAVKITCTSYSEDLKKKISSLQNCKTTNQNAQLFIDFKRAQSKLRSLEIQKAEMSLAKANAGFHFERNKELKRILLAEGFGKLKEPNVLDAVASVKPDTQDKKRMFKSLTLKTNRSTSTKKDKRTPDITGCVVMSSNKLVLADWDNKKIKVLDLESNVVTEEMKLDVEPFIIARLPEERIAVTLPQGRKVLFMTTADKLSKEHSTTVNGECRGITYHQGLVYVICRHPHTVYAMDRKGSNQFKVTLGKEGVFLSSNYIEFSQDHKLMYIGSFANNSVVSVTLQGEVCTIYTDQKMIGVLGMLVLDDGSLLVCCKDNGTIHHISADLKQSKKVMSGLTLPRCLCYSADRSQVYVVGGSGELQVFTIHYTT